MKRQQPITCENPIFFGKNTNIYYIVNLMGSKAIFFSILTEIESLYDF